MLAVSDDRSSPDRIGPSEIMDPSCPYIGKDRLPLDGDVGRIRHGCKGESLPTEGWVMMDLVIVSDGLDVGESSGGEDGVLLGVQTLIGKLDSVFLGHGKS